MSLLERMDALIAQLETEDIEFFESLDLDFARWRQQRNANQKIYE